MSTPTSVTTTTATPSSTGTSLKPGFRALYQPTDLVIVPRCNETQIDLTVPKIYVDNTSEGQISYSTCYGLSENKPNLNAVKPAVAAYFQTNTPTPEGCAASVDQMPINGAFEPPTTGKSICLRLDDTRVATLVVTGQDAKTHRLNLKVTAWELQ